MERSCDMVVRMGSSYDAPQKVSSVVLGELVTMCNEAELPVREVRPSLNNRSYGGRLMEMLSFDAEGRPHRRAFMMCQGTRDLGGAAPARATQAICL